MWLINHFLIYQKSNLSLTNDYSNKNLRHFSSENSSNSASNNPVHSIWTAFKTYAGLQGGNPDKIAQDIFEHSVNLLLAEDGNFKYRNFHNYLKGLCEYCGIIGPKAKAEDKLDESLRFLLNQYKITKVMTTSELEANSHKYFTKETKKLLAEAANVDLQVVENTLLHFDVCKTDRKWYLLRQALGRPLPRTYDEREYESYQRPILQQVKMKNPPTLEAEMIVDKYRESKKYIDHNKRKMWPWFRKPTSGISRWRTRPFTKYFPHHLIKL